MSDVKGAAQFHNPDTMSRPTGYSHVVEIKAGRTIYTAGQVALDPSGQLVGKGDLRAQTVQVFENLKAALAAAGAGFEHVIKFNLYLVDITQVIAVRDVRNQYINIQQPPVSTAVQVSRLAHPDWLIEIEAVAYLPE